MNESKGRHEPGQGNLLRLHGRWKDNVPQEPKWPESLQEVSFGSFPIHFKMNFASVCERLTYLRSMSDTRNLLCRALTESIITQIAAMCVENPRHKENYTIQGLLKRQKRVALEQQINEALNRVLCLDCDGNELTVGMCIKILRNKFICHFDNFEDYDLTGKEGVGDGKWTLADKEVLFKLLITDAQHIDDLVATISTILETADRMCAEDLSVAVAEEISQISSNRATLLNN